MTRIVSYNMLAGGYSLRENAARRTEQLAKMIHSAQPDIVGLVEATHPQMPQPWLVAEELAEKLGMQLVRGGEAAHAHDYQLALLTRLPIISTRIHPRPGILNKPLLEVCVEEEDGNHLTVFVTHLWAAFYKGWAGNGLRKREMKEILTITRPYREKNIPHLIMGDFNSLAPGDLLKASHLLRYVIAMDNTKRDLHIADGHPHLNFVVPGPLRFLNPLLRVIPRSMLLSSIFDALAGFYAPRGCVHMIREEAGYIDCYRRTHPKAWGFTCPAGAPAGRIDYIFASPALSKQLETCYVLLKGEDDQLGSQASDHLAIAAEFGLRVQQPAPNQKTEKALSEPSLR